MSQAGVAGRGFGRGPLSRASALVYNLLVVELLFLATTLPGLAGLVLLDRSAGNIPLAAACALPLGPALSAALYALRRRSRDLADLRPAAAFWRGYRANARGVLKLWVPWLAGMAVIATNLANLGAAGVPGWWAGPLVLVAVGATLWAGNALVITSLFEFRAVDVARLAAYFLGRRPAVTLANLSLLVVAGGLTLVATEAAVALLAAGFAAVLLWNSRSLADEVEREFTA
ncbi:DUF624 domain-containing protein [Nonomuraea jiangxiensis]|uniref:DUF624 domain-containing protein n=1 Tax=Nonomuraea jiangxiensis TaxID=633440 RepID=A0A1G9AXJ1_9ACTN|nr:DUF624 domain-containing protein [Nonomuraea jiangxiensis]SDK31972.1 Protein of unknown function, DUF624 [Nonomuraea jiangxiensis]